MNIEYANAIPMRLILEKLGVTHIGKSDSQLLYQSIFHQSHEPNFVVDVVNNRWSDLADNTSGTPLDFVRRHLATTGKPDSIKDAEHWLKAFVGYAILQAPTNIQDFRDEDKRYQYLEHQHLQTPYLVDYLEQVRGIPYDIAQFNLTEVTVRDLKTGKTFLALGIKTEENTFSIRNQYVKAQLKKPYISFIRGKCTKIKSIHVFKDVFDYLTAVKMRKGNIFKDDVLILNSYSNMPLSGGFIYNYEYRHVYTWLDNTSAGLKATKNYRRYLKTQIGSKHQPMNKGYADFQSLNEWAIMHCKTAIQP